jgi:hypothetical protein
LRRRGGRRVYLRYYPNTRGVSQRTRFCAAARPLVASAIDHLWPHPSSCHPPPGRISYVGTRRPRATRQPPGAIAHAPTDPHLRPSPPSSPQSPPHTDFRRILLYGCCPARFAAAFRGMVASPPRHPACALEMPPALQWRGAPPSSPLASPAKYSRRFPRHSCCSCRVSPGCSVGHPVAWLLSQHPIRWGMSGHAWAPASGMLRTPAAAPSD